MPPLPNPPHPKPPKPSSHTFLTPPTVAHVLVAIAALTSLRPWDAPGDAAVLKAFIVNWVSAAAVSVPSCTPRSAAAWQRLWPHRRPVRLLLRMVRPLLARQGIPLIHRLLLSGAYPAIVGNVIFILCPAWRQIHVEERKKMRAQERMP